jgi:hypothetical protein
MQRAVSTCLLTVIALSLTGCPIYPSDNLCHSNLDCAPGYVCDTYSGACLQLAANCDRPSDCTGISETCASDGTCQIGSCEQVGCVFGYTCRIDQDVWTCVSNTETPDAS